MNKRVTPYIYFIGNLPEWEEDVFFVKISPGVQKT
jgi:hypothetical protein